MEPSEEAVKAAYEAMAKMIWSAEGQARVGDLAMDALRAALKAAYAIDRP